MTKVLFCSLFVTLLFVLVVNIPLAVAFAYGSTVVTQDIIMTVLCSLVAVFSTISIVLLGRSYFLGKKEI